MVPSWAGKQVSEGELAPHGAEKKRRNLFCSALAFWPRRGKSRKSAGNGCTSPPVKNESSCLILRFTIVQFRSGETFLPKAKELARESRVTAKNLGVHGGRPGWYANCSGMADRRGEKNAPWPTNRGAEFTVKELCEKSKGPDFLKDSLRKKRTFGRGRRSKIYVGLANAFCVGS